MLRSRGHSDKSSDGRSGRRNPLVIAVSVVCALAVLVAAALLLKNPILYSAAQRQAEKENFIFAESLNKHCSSADSQLLAEYLDLRIDIDLRYPEMLSNFDPEIFRGWGERASTLAASSDAFKPALASQVKALEYKLSVACARLNEYDFMQQDIGSLMDVFAEINRLYTKDDSGKNTAFSVARELEKIEEWERLGQSLSDFAGKLPNGESVYLLTYLIKESRGECDDLRAAMDTVLGAGYSPTDLVRLSGEAHKSFPSMKSSSGSSVTLLQKEEYMRFMYSGVCRALVEYIGEFYTG